MSERVRLDVVDFVREEAAFYLSTILRVIDEESAFWDEHPNAEDVHPKYVLRALRARFEEADDGE